MLEGANALAIPVIFNMLDEVEPNIQDEVFALKTELLGLRKRLEDLESRLNPGPSEAPAAAALSAPASSPIAKSVLKKDSLEARIGSHWLNRIGIIAVLFGAAYFIKLAFENNWIGPAGRIVIGLLAGIAVIVWSERFRRHGYAAFSHSLKAIGLGTLYVSLWAAFQVYHLLPAGMGFAAMVLVTVAALVMALRQNAQILATMALFGGFATPALVSSGENHEVFLFSYTAVLSVAAAIFSIRKRWQAVLFTALLGTWGYYIEWFSRFYSHDQLAITLLFIALFFAIFLLPPLFALPGKTEKLARDPLAVLLALNAAVSFIAFYDLLQNKALYGDAIAWVTVVLAAIYLVLSRLARAERIRLLHVAVGLGFFTIAIPLKLHAEFITLGWLIESAAILYVATRTANKIFGVAGLAALLLGIYRLIIIDVFAPERPFWNMRALLFAIAISILALAVHHTRRLRNAEGLWQVCSGVLTIVALIGLDREISFAILPLGIEHDKPAWRGAALLLNFTRSAVWMAYGAAAMVLGFLKRIAFYRWQALVILALTICKVFLYDIEQLNEGYRVVSFIALGVILLAVSYAYQRDWLKLSKVERQGSDLRA